MPLKIVTPALDSFNYCEKLLGHDCPIAVAPPCGHCEPFGTEDTAKAFGATGVGVDMYDLVGGRE
jgi:hypothetical protein